MAWTPSNFHGPGRRHKTGNIQLTLRQNYAECLTAISLLDRKLSDLIPSGPCGNCSEYEGGANGFHCAMYPYGPEDEKCEDQSPILDLSDD